MTKPSRSTRTSVPSYTQSSPSSPQQIASRPCASAASPSTNPGARATSSQVRASTSTRYSCPASPPAQTTPRAGSQHTPSGWSSPSTSSSITHVPHGPVDRQAALHDQFLAGHVARRGRGQEEDDVRDLVGGADP